MLLQLFPVEFILIFLPFLALAHKFQKTTQMGHVTEFEK